MSSVHPTPHWFRDNDDQFAMLRINIGNVPKMQILAVFLILIQTLLGRTHESVILE